MILFSHFVYRLLGEKAHYLSTQKSVTQTSLLQSDVDDKRASMFQFPKESAPAGRLHVGSAKGASQSIGSAGVGSGSAGVGFATAEGSAGFVPALRSSAAEQETSGASQSVAPLCSGEAYACAPEAHAQSLGAKPTSRGEARAPRPRAVFAERSAGFAPALQRAMLVTYVGGFTAAIHPFSTQRRRLRLCLPREGRSPRAGLGFASVRQSVGQTDTAAKPAPSIYFKGEALSNNELFIVCQEKNIFRFIFFLLKRCKAIEVLATICVAILQIQQVVKPAEFKKGVESPRLRVGTIGGLHWRFDRRHYAAAQAPALQQSMRSLLHQNYSKGVALHRFCFEVSSRQISTLSSLGRKVVETPWLLQIFFIPYVIFFGYFFTSIFFHCGGDLFIYCAGSASNASFAPFMKTQTSGVINGFGSILSAFAPKACGGAPLQLTVLNTCLQCGIHFMQLCSTPSFMLANELLRGAHYASKIFLVWSFLTIWNGIRPGQSTKSESTIQVRMNSKTKKRLSDLEGISKFLPLLETCIQSLKRQPALFVIWAQLRSGGPGFAAALTDFAERSAGFASAWAPWAQRRRRRGRGEARAQASPLRSYARATRKYPKGYLFIGPPGTGKTLLAQAVAGEAGVPFIGLSASEIQKQISLGTKIGAVRLRNLFLQVKQRTPCILFFDEIDSIAGRSQSADEGVGSAERSVGSASAAPLTQTWPPHRKEKTDNNIPSPDFELQESNFSGDFSWSDYSQSLQGRGLERSAGFAPALRSLRSPSHEANPHAAAQKSIKPTSNRPTGDITLFTEFLIQMDGVQPGLVIIGTTNFLNHLDSAFIRSGRFDRILGLTYPGKNTRFDLLRLYTEKTRGERRSPATPRVGAMVSAAERSYALQSPRYSGFASRSLRPSSAELMYFAEQTHGWTAADLATLVNESFLYLCHQKFLAKKGLWGRLRRGEAHGKPPELRATAPHFWESSSGEAAPYQEAKPAVVIVAFCNFISSLYQRKPRFPLVHTYKSLAAGMKKLSTREKYT